MFGVCLAASRGPDEAGEVVQHGGHGCGSARAGRLPIQPNGFLALTIADGYPG